MNAETIVPMASVVFPKMMISWLDHTTWYIRPAAPDATKTPMTTPSGRRLLASAAVRRVAHLSCGRSACSTASNACVPRDQLQRRRSIVLPPVGSAASVEHVFCHD